jgi:hypothetical protein
MMLEIEYNPAKREFYIELLKKILNHCFDGFDSGLKDGGGESNFNGVR